MNNYADHQKSNTPAKNPGTLMFASTADSNNVHTPTVGISGRTPTAQGGFLAPTASTDGVELGSRPAATSGVRIEIPSGGNATYYFTTSGTSPGSAPTYTKTVAGPITVDEPLAPGDGIFFTALTGTVIARFIQR